MATSCSKQEVQEQKGIPMSFYAEDVETVSRVLLDGASVNSPNNQLKVYDRYSLDGNAVLYMDGTEVTCNGSAWTYSPLKYWTEQGIHSFLTYLHKINEKYVGQTYGCTTSYNKENHTLTVGPWSISENNQFDYLYARHGRGMSEADPYRAVEFQMNHLLCAVQFNVVNLYDVSDPIEVQYFELSGVTNNQQAIIYGLDGTVNYTATDGSTVVIRGRDSGSVNYNQAFNAFENIGNIGQDGFLLMWPHDIEKYNNLAVSFLINNELRTAGLSSGNTKHWEAGQKYIYNLYIKDDRINMQVTVRPWITDDVELE